MYRITAICDKCKKEETQDRQAFDKDVNHWKVITLEISRHNQKDYLLCPDCQKALGICEPKTNKEEQVETIADRLMECIAEIVAETVQAGE